MADRALWSVAVEAGTELRFGTPERLGPRGFYTGSYGRTYDVSPDGKRFVVIRVGDTTGEEAGRDVVMIENWFEELKRLVPVGGR